jgi:hypothetical protein
MKGGGGEGNIPRVSVPRLRWAFVVGVLLLASTPAATADGLMVQQIGDAGGRIAEAVAKEAVAACVTIVPFSPRLDVRATPIILPR